ncbi:MAG: Inactivated LAGLIDADG family endonuclease and N-terminal HTH domain [Candidatus Methanohalarchaeum thermophilum]|uniref:Inactivated LAGLIDADG family endonuclease and N-terminal HTH domain n=1 Tax=Methanohalarchaeum thermophilum TaxID=1903181 RepID=A0A1Q6DV97_METT1|nr:MAG: Inactivated LAGLIDADG family endonuclease and N-terminal HTH domain [Candidatus Methanohalarchaeum thermophilum]
MDPISEKDFMETYSRYDKPTDILKEYRETMNHQNKSSYKLSRELNIPRGRIREWKSGSKPDFIKGLEKARKLELVDIGFSSDRFREINKLVSWVFSGGSINKWYAPSFSIENKQKQKLFQEIAGELGFEYELIRENKADKATEARLKNHQSIIGRALVALGAPIGTQKTNGLTLPTYLKNKKCPIEIKKDFTGIYLINRGFHDRDNGMIRFREKRSKEYLKELCNLFKEATNKKVSLSEKNLIIHGNPNELSLLPGFSSYF